MGESFDLVARMGAGQARAGAAARAKGGIQPGADSIDGSNKGGECWQQCRCDENGCDIRLVGTAVVEGQVDGGFRLALVS